MRFTVLTIFKLEMLMKYFVNIMIVYSFSFLKGLHGQCGPWFGDKCRVDGGFSSWSPFSPCSVTCENGIVKSTRTCTNPAPSNGGIECVGVFFKTESCNLPPCQVDGGFSEWGLFSPCSVSCGDGLIKKSRTCTNPAPSGGGKNCVGDFLETKACSLATCKDFEEISEHVLVKDTMVKTISLLEKAYSVSFKLKLHTYLSGWRSIIHLTTEGNTGVYGYRTPAVWVYTEKLTVWSAISGYSDYYFITAKTLPLNEWLSIRISQIWLNGVYTFKVYIDGRVAYNDNFNTDSVTNTDPKPFQNVKVYVADPWYETQDASIKDLRILNGNCEQIIEDRETRLAQRNLVAVIPRLEKSYRIFFDVKPNSFSKGWHNIIHFTVGSDSSKYGDRVPGVWFHNSGDGSLYIASHINGNLDSFFKTEPIALKEWSRVEISQLLQGSIYIYRIKLNGNLVYVLENTQPKSFDNVQVYASNPWHIAQDGSIRDLNIINGLSDDKTLPSVVPVLKDFVEEVTEEVLKKDNLIATLPFLEKSYSVSFKIKPTSYLPGYRNVIHLTTGGDSGVFGFRTPSVWFYGDTGKLSVWSAINGNPNYEIMTPRPLPLNKWSSIRVSQVRVNSVYLFRIYVDGKLGVNIENTDPRSFKNVKVYKADPWWDTQPGSIKDLRIFNGNVDQLIEDREASLVQNKLLAVVPKLDKTYKVYFDVKPNLFSEGWNNVIRFNVGSNASKYDDRTPGVWFHNSGDGSLSVSAPLNGNLESSFKTVPIPVNVWSHIEINQQLVGSAFVYTMKLNGEKVLVVENVQPEIFENVQVYTSDLWYKAQDGVIKSLAIINGQAEDVSLANVDLVSTDFVEFSTEEILKKDNYLEMLPLLETTYSLSFQTKPTSYSLVWKNVIHLTTGVDGSRTPGVWFYLDTIHIWSAGGIYFISSKLPLNKWSKIRLSQERINGIFAFTVYVDGKITNSITNIVPQSFKNVMVYVADPWWDAQGGYIKDLRIVNGNLEKIIEDRETRLAQRNLVAVVPRLEKSYRIFFDVKPNSFSKGWHNVIHFTIGSDASKYGDRVPGVWFHNSGDGSLSISAPLNGNLDSSFKTASIPVNVWSHIEISQLLEGSAYIYRIKLNENFVFIAENKQPKSFDNVQVYASNPWYQVQDGLIKDLSIMNGLLNDKTLPSVVLVFKDFVEEVSEEVLNKNNLIATLSSVEKAYSVSFMIKPTSYSPGYKNVIHLTTEGNSGVFGFRTPSVWFYGDTGKLSVWSAISGNPNYEVITPQALPLNKWSSVKVSQVRVNNIYSFRVYLNERLNINVENTDPRLFKNVKVYNADPWYDVQLGSIKDLKIVNGNVEQLIEDRETPLVQNKLVAVVPKLDKTYKIYFDVKPNSFAEGWHNVIRFNIGSDGSKYNDRVPGVWFHNSGKGSLSISAPLYGNLDSSFKTAPVPANVWSHLEISQQLENSVYVYTIKLNGEKVYIVENRHPEFFYNVQVFASDQWYQTQDGLIKDLAIVNGKGDDVTLANVELVTKGFDFPTEEVFKRDNLIGMLPLLEATYSISFKIKPTSYLVGWRSVIHLTVGGDGSRIPAMWFYDDTGMHVWSGGSVYFKTPQILLNTWSNIKISQEQVNGVYRFRMYVNGIITNNVSNIAAQSYKNVLVYASDPWWSEQFGSIKDLQIVNGNTGK